MSPKEIKKLNKPSDIYKGMTGNDVYNENRPLIEMYKGAMYLYPEYSEYYNNRIEVLRLECES